MLPVHDITKELKELELLVVPADEIVKAERSGSEVLILLKEDNYHFRLLNWTVRKEINDVIYSDYSTFTRPQIHLRKGLFEQFSHL